MKHLLLIAFCSILLIACCKVRKTSRENSPVSVKEIPFTEVEGIFNDTMAKQCNFLILEDTCQASLFADISKLKIKNNQIYILDFSGSKSLHVFDLSGKFLYNVGQAGRAPGEYKKIFDFDVNDSGIHLYDGANRNMLIYNADGQFLRMANLPFQAYNFNLLENGDYLFSLSKTPGGSKVIVTDSLFELKKEYSEFAENDTEDKFCVGTFQETPSGIVYNRAVNDTIFVFGKNGGIEQAYYINFENKRMPEPLRKSYQNIVNERENHDFRYFFSTPVLVHDHIIGNIYAGNKKALVDIDTKGCKSSMKLLQEGCFNTTDPFIPLFVTDNSLIVSYLNQGIYDIVQKNYDIEQKFIEHMEQGGTILCFYH